MGEIDNNPKDPKIMLKFYFVTENFKVSKLESYHMLYRARPKSL